MRIWRARKARRLLRRMITDVYEKKFDENSGTWFYFNRKTGESHWEKPLGLQSDDINVSSRTADVAKTWNNIKQENIFVRKKTQMRNLAKNDIARPIYQIVMRQ